MPPVIRQDHSFVGDLGFDSLGVVMLGVALEDAFGVPILLDGWIASEDNPAELTVASLVRHVTRCVNDG